MSWILCEDPGTPLWCFIANGEVLANEEAPVYVHDLNLIVTVQLLEETPAVLSLGKLCEDHGYSYVSLTKEGKNIIFKTDNFVPVVPGLSSSSGSNLSSTSRHRRTRQVHLQVHRQSEVTIRLQGNWSDSPITQNKNQKRSDILSLRRPFARSPRMVGGVHRQSRRHRST